MKLTLVNSQSEDEICLDAEAPVLIGRGTLLKCNDKKVSRNHGKLQLTPDGKVHLVALHANPCFVMKNGLPPVQHLVKNEEKILSDGDYIGLLPDSFWFRIVIQKESPSNSKDLSCKTLADGDTSSKASTSRENNEIIKDEKISEEQLNSSLDIFNKFKSGTLLVRDSSSEKKSQSKNEDVKVIEAYESSLKTVEESLSAPVETSNNTVTIESPPETVEYTSSTSKQTGDGSKGDDAKEEPNICEKKYSESSPDSLLAERLKALEHTKKLPLWMYEIDDFPVGEQKEESRGISPDHKDESCSKEMADTTKAESSQLCTSKNDAKSDIGATSSKEDYVQNLEASSEEKGPVESAIRNSTYHKEKAAKPDKDEADVLAGVGSSQGSQRRPLCQYEGECYRKNEQHKRDFIHPGDADFIPYERRPVCQYGSSCYRQSKSHRVEYQHPKENPSKKPARNSLHGSPQRKKKKKQVIEYESEEEDDYDMDDPFLDDATSDDYVPSDTASEDGFGF